MRRGYGQFCPVSKAAEVLAERWVPLVVRELLNGSRRFSELRRGLPLISPTVLSQRLKALEDAGVVERRENEHHLTAAGEALRPIVEQLGAWGRRWVQHEIRKEDLDPRFLMWAVHRRLDTSALPPGRVVLQFELRDGPVRQRRWWIVVTDGEVDLCLRHPGHAVDLTISAAVGTLARVYVGQVDARVAVSSSEIILVGSAPLARAFPRWFPKLPASGAALPAPRGATTVSG